MNSVEKHFTKIEILHEQDKHICSYRRIDAQFAFGLLVMACTLWFVLLWMLEFSALHIVVGLLFAVLALFVIASKTVIEIKRNELSVFRMPIPFRGNLVIPIEDIDCAFYTESKTQNHMMIDNQLIPTGTVIVYEIVIKKKNEETATVLDGLNDLTETRAITNFINDSVKKFKI